MANHLVNILGDLLYRKGIKDDEKELPSPMFLRRKILVKAKRLPTGATRNYDVNKSEDDDDDQHDDSKNKKNKAKNKNNVVKQYLDLISCRKSLKSCQTL